ncbi:MAG: tetratricopeptide repeat protein [Lysobacterales bacterium]|jgi:hypothetical protein
MPIISALIWLAQIALVVHVLKTGRNRYWIMMLIFIPPPIGAIAYVVIELLPEFTGSITGQRAMRNVKRSLNPGAELRRCEAAWQQSPNVDNARHYAGALHAAGRDEDAQEVIDQALKGLFSTEPTLLLLKAQILFEQDRPRDAVEALQTLQQHNPDFHSPEGHLLYARALEADGQIEAAIREYSSVAGYFPGVEARYRLALCLKNAGRDAAAKSELNSILTDARLAPAHFRRSQKHWLDAVRHEAG